MQTDVDCTTLHYVISYEHDTNMLLLSSLERMYGTYLGIRL